jgi:hypothetical protein
MCSHRKARGIKSLVPSKGLEPPHPCEYMDLNHARLPIPPRWQLDSVAAAALRPPYQEEQPFYSTEVLLCVKPQAAPWPSDQPQTRVNCCSSI